VTDEDKNPDGGQAAPDENSKAVELTEPAVIDETVEAKEPVDADDSPTDDAVEAEETPTRRSAPRGIRRHIGAILVTVALVASAGVAGWLYFYQYRVDQQTNEAATNVALEAAKNGTVALLSYSPESLDKDFAAAKSNLTGDFLSYYTQFTEQIVTPAAKEKQVKTAASVARAAVSEMHPDSATVLVFVNQVTTSKENPDGAFAASSVKVGLKKIDGRWLINTFDPV
jgi:Mce-associated membrane protein